MSTADVVCAAVVTSNEITCGTFSLLLICSRFYESCKTLAQANSGKAVPLTTLVGTLYKDQGIAGKDVTVASFCSLYGRFFSK